ncbi:MAG: hypothetical protein WCO56_00910 [Verrucomicrobiota bacterium]
MNEIKEVQNKFDAVFDSVMSLARQKVLTGDALSELQTRLGTLQQAINDLKKTCQAPSVSHKT